MTEAAALQGAPVVTQDIDLWFKDLGDPRLTKALRAVGAGYVPPSHLIGPMFAGDICTLFDIVLRMDGLKTFTEEVDGCLDIRVGNLELKVLGLDRILASKRATNRLKDQLAIPVLKDSMAARSRAKRKTQKPKPAKSAKVGRLKQKSRPKR